MRTESFKLIRMLLLIGLILVATFVYKAKLGALAVIITAVILLLILIITIIIKIQQYNSYCRFVDRQYHKFYNRCKTRHPKIVLLGAKFSIKLQKAYKKQYKSKTVLKIIQICLYACCLVLVAIFLFTSL